MPISEVRNFCERTHLLTSLPQVKYILDADLTLEPTLEMESELQGRKMGGDFASSGVGLTCQVDRKSPWYLLLSFSIPEHQGRLLLVETKEGGVERRKTSCLSSVEQRGWEVVGGEGAQKTEWLNYRDLPLSK